MKKLISVKTIQKKDELAGKALKFTLKDIVPFYVAKRILAMFCSVDYPGISEDIPEIRKAILQKDYVPNTSDFSIYLCLHCDSGAFFATIAALKLPNIIECFSGVETAYTGFYFKRTEKNKQKPNTLGDCLNITNWLTECEPGKKYRLDFTLLFSKTMALNVPIPE